MSEHTQIRKNIKFTEEAKSFLENNSIEEMTVKVVQRGGG